MVYTIDEIKEKIQPIAEKYHLSKVYLFGSYARGEADEESDVDLMIDDDIDLFDYWSFQADIEEAIGNEVDVLLMSEVKVSKSPVIQLLRKYYEKDKVLVYEIS